MLFAVGACKGESVRANGARDHGNIESNRNCFDLSESHVLFGFLVKIAKRENTSRVLTSNERVECDMQALSFDELIYRYTRRWPQPPITIAWLFIQNQILFAATATVRPSSVKAFDSFLSSESTGEYLKLFYTILLKRRTRRKFWCFVVRPSSMCDNSSSSALK